MTTRLFSLAVFGLLTFIQIIAEKLGIIKSYDNSSFYGYGIFILPTGLLMLVSSIALIASFLSTLFFGEKEKKVTCIFCSVGTIGFLAVLILIIAFWISIGKMPERDLMIFVAFLVLPPMIYMATMYFHLENLPVE